MPPIAIRFKTNAQAKTMMISKKQVSFFLLVLLKFYVIIQVKKINYE